MIEDLKIKNIARIAETDSAFADIVFFYKFHLLTFTYSFYTDRQRSDPVVAIPTGTTV